MQCVGSYRDHCCLGLAAISIAWRQLVDFAHSPDGIRHLLEATRRCVDWAREAYYQPSTGEYPDKEERETPVSRQLSDHLALMMDTPT
jgi:hypothetical protein